MVKSGGDGDSSHIRTFLRIRPSKHPSGFIKVDEYDKTRLGFHVPVETKDGEVGLCTGSIDTQRDGERTACDGWRHGRLIMSTSLSRPGLCPHGHPLLSSLSSLSSFRSWRYTHHTIALKQQ